MDSLKKFCAWVENDKSIRCVIIAGAKPLPAEEGKRPKPNAFVAGADISEFVGMDSVATKIKFTDNAVEALWGLTKPTIAMVDGFALGGGCEVACSCDIRIASDRAKFGTPEINLGLIPGYGATQRLAKLIGYGKTLEMVMTGEMIDAAEAKSIGLQTMSVHQRNWKILRWIWQIKLVAIRLLWLLQADHQSSIKQHLRPRHSNRSTRVCQSI